MSKALVLGAAALALSAGTASAQGYGYGYGYDNGYAAPVADLAAPNGYGYGAPGYAAPAYAAPGGAGTIVIIVTPGSGYTAPPVASGYYGTPGPGYTAPPVVASGYYGAGYGAGVVSQPIYDYAPGYRGGRGYRRRW
ncbi:MAG: hypothetical protein WBE48_07435 [Xanthobacteraceae bacterium]